jgi:hypothetical protein
MRHMQVDASGWSGEGDFTQTLVEALRHVAGVEGIRVEDAPASRAEAGYSFISNEIYLWFRRDPRREPVRRFGFLPGTRTVLVKAQTLAGVEAALAAAPEVGPPDYTDDGMLQYLRAQRIVPPYQTRGYKLVEMVRVYEAADTIPGSRA